MGNVFNCPLSNDGEASSTSLVLQATQLIVEERRKKSQSAQCARQYTHKINEDHIHDYSRVTSTTKVPDTESYIHTQPQVDSSTVRDEETNAE